MPLQTGQDTQFLIETFGSLSSAWANALQPIALKLFWSLAFLDFCWWAFELWREDRFEDIFRGLVHRVVLICFWWSFLTHNQEWLHAITDSFAQAGKRAAAAGGMTADISPMGLFQQGMQIFHGVQNAMAGTSLLTNASVVLIGNECALGIVIGFLILMLQFLIAKIEIDLVLGASVLLLAFGGSRWTRPYAERVIGCAITAGVRIMFIYLVFGASQPLVNKWIATTQSMPVSALFDVTLGILGSVVVYVAITWFAPSLADRMVSGAGGLSASSAIGLAGAAMAGGTALAGMVASGGTSAAVGAAKAATGAASGAGGAAASNLSHAAMSQAIGGFGGGFGGAGVDAPPPPHLPAPPLSEIATIAKPSGNAGGPLDVPVAPSISTSAQPQSHAAGGTASISSTNTNTPATLNSRTTSTTPRAATTPVASASSTTAPAEAPALATPHTNQASAEPVPPSVSNSTPDAASISGAPAPAAPAVTGPASSTARNADAEPATPQLPPPVSAPQQKQTPGPDVEKLAQALRSMPETGGHVPAPRLKVEGD